MKKQLKALVISTIFLIIITTVFINIFTANEVHLLQGYVTNYNASNEQIIQTSQNLGLIEIETLYTRNCSKSFGFEQSNLVVILNKYNGAASGLRIDENIKMTSAENATTYKVSSIDIDCFKDSMNLEIIQIANSVATKITSLEGFEKSTSLSESGYTAYITTRDYTNEYKEFLRQYSNMTAEERRKVEIIPSKFGITTGEATTELQRLQKLYNMDSIAPLPSSFDIRSTYTGGKSLEVKDQGSTGTCYAFALTTAVETNKNIRSKNLNFSEIHTAVMSGQGCGGLYTTTFKQYYDIGLGPVKESLNPAVLDLNQIKLGRTELTQNMYAFCTGAASFSGSSLKNLQQGLENAVGTIQSSDMYFVIKATPFVKVSGEWKTGSSASSHATTVKANRDLIKEHIRTYGAVAVAICADSQLSPGSSGQKAIVRHTSTAVSNHAVVLIGWDDNEDNGRGAYLALNSWGSSWGVNGTFWVSYDDYNVEKDAYGVIAVQEGKINIADADITVGDRTYDGGKPLIPNVIVKYNGVVLDSDCYDIACENNTEPGTATCIITGKGLFEGSVTKTFTIHDNYSSFDFTIQLDQRQFTYDGTPKIPKVTVKYQNTLLTEGIDYTYVCYPNAIDCNENVALQVNFMGKYKGSEEENYSISPFNLENATIAPIEDQAYTGRAITPSPVVTVTLNNSDTPVVLKKDKDYTCTYNNNTEIGQATLTITGKGNYTGSKTIHFNIVSNTLPEIPVTINTYDGPYDGKPHGVTVTTTVAGAQIRYGETEGTYNLTESPTRTEIGSSNVYIKVTADGYKSKVASAIIKISRADGKIVLSESSGSVKKGETRTFTITEATGDLTVNSLDTNIATATLNGQTVTIEGKNEGQVRIEIKAAANVNYRAETVYYTVNVTTDELEVLEVVATGYNDVYDGKPHGITVVPKKQVTGLLIKYGTTEGTYNLNSSPTYTDVSENTVYFEVSADNYETARGYATVKITKAPGELELSENNGTVKVGKTKTFEVENNSGNVTVTSNDSTIAEATINGKTVTVRGIKEGSTTIKVTSGANNNYESVTKNYSITVTNLLDIEGISVQGFDGPYDGDPHGITVTVSTEGVSIKYGIQEGTYNSNSSPTFTNVSTNKVYYKIEKSGYQTETGYATVKINKANRDISLSENNGNVKIGTTTNFTLSGKLEDAVIRVSSEDSNIATATIVNQTVTVTGVGQGTTRIKIFSESTDNYLEEEKYYTILVHNLEEITGVRVNSYDGPYDKKAHGIEEITCDIEGVSIKYGERENECNLNDSPTYINSGTYTVYYQIEKNGYQPIKSSAVVKINKLDASIELTNTTDKPISIGSSITITANCNNEEDSTVNAVSVDPTIATIRINGNNISITGVKAGTTSIKISCNESANYKYSEVLYPVTIINRKLKEIIIENEPKYKEYIEDTDFNPEGMKVIAKYDNTDTEEITDYEIVDGTKLQLGKTSVTISYTEGDITKTASQPITVKKKSLDRIEVTHEPDKTDYIEEQNFDNEGMEVTAFYDNGSSNVIRNYSIIGGTNLKAGTTFITLSYEEDGIQKETTQNITVAEKKLDKIEITKEPNKTVYVSGQKFNSSGMEVLATYDNGKTKIIKDYDIIDGTNLSVDQKYVTISYTENDITKTANVSIVVILRVAVRIDVISSPDKTSYRTGEDFNPSGMTVEVTYNDGTREIINNYYVNDGTTLSSGQDTVTISYTENDVTVSTSQSISVSGVAITIDKTKMLNKITVTRYPNKLKYIEGEDFDTTGMEITAIYSDGSRSKVTGYEIVNGNNLKVGIQNIIISYTEDGHTRTTKQNIVVSKPDNDDNENENGSESLNLGYEVKDKIIIGVKPKTPIANFKTELLKNNNNYEAILTKKDEDVLEGYVHTGMMVKIVDKDGQVVKDNDGNLLIYDIAVTGDVDGNGLANYIDTQMIKLYRVEQIQLSDVEFKAADVDNDGKVGFLDSKLLLFHRAEIQGYNLNYQS